MLTLVLVAALTIISSGDAAAITTCKEIPKIIIPDLQPFIDGSPYNYVLGTARFNCGVKVFTNPPNGETDIDMFGLLVKGAQVTTYKISIFNNSQANAVDCNGGEQVTWYLSKVFQDETTGALGYCFVSCKDDNTIQDFGCGTNNVEALQDAQKAYANQFKNVRYETPIEDSAISCFGSSTCPTFSYQ